MSPPDGAKVILNDTDHLWGIGGDVAWVWTSFLRGLNPLYMDPYDDTANESVRLNLGYARQYAERVDLARMMPHGELCSTEICLADPGSEYLVFARAGGVVTIDLSAVDGELSVEWFDPWTADIVAGDPVSGGGPVDLTAPLNGDAVLYLRR